MIVKTRAVVLRETKFRDQSKICMLFTREFGKVSVILKGARNPKSRLSGKFSPGSVLDIVLYKKPNRDVQLVSDGNIVYSPLAAEPDMEKFAAMYLIVDLIDQALDGEEKNLQLFWLLENSLDALYRMNRYTERLLVWFLLRMVSLLGFEPSIKRCVYSDEEIEPAIETMKLRELLFVMNPGGIAIPATATGRTPHEQRISADAFLTLLAIAETPLSELGNIPALEAETTLLAALLQDYCSIHLEQAPRASNLAVVAQMLLK
ncbi:MAG: DNA repair protein RecO [Chlorobium sp.]|uniref:DNA repair protein RecO n=1 Tax=Chlorobium sp. TaxID=1095 RepID=UPI001E05D293|nr:DNA repair protein RecO [Chlorobium sp.]MBN1278551.1 DNA repair protein RecO [Chlorobiaceae bacterium]MCF8215543.1 DNA repair protein RecO [Chlorobium sp.]MCF8270403.1 DNA repair protein RecO [Chlorobium sp.]MCF8286773.1 DNA repair protein RecO [Chlorobium sp.]MCF8290295.1 DNA repair protein RecO [Chlorobium sp.]